MKIVRSRPAAGRRFPTRSSARFLLAFACASLAAGQAGSLHAQLLKPESNFHIAVNGVFAFCPRLIRRDAAPDAAELEALGLTAIAPVRAGEISFESPRRNDLLQISYDPTERRCIVHYGGPGFVHVAGMVRDTARQNGLPHLTGGERGGAKGDVFEGPIPGLPIVTRIIIIENPASRTATISYVEKPGS